MLEQPTRLIAVSIKASENYFVKPDVEHEPQIPREFYLEIKRLDCLIPDLSQLSLKDIYDYIPYVISVLVKHQNPEKRPILDGGHALYHHLTTKLKDCFDEYIQFYSSRETTKTDGLIPTPFLTDIDLLDRYYSSLDSDIKEDFLKDLATCIDYGLGSYRNLVAAILSDPVEISDFETYKNRSDKNQRVTIRRTLKSRSLSIVSLKYPYIHKPGADPILDGTFIIRVDFNYGSRHLEAHHSQNVSINGHETLMPVRSLERILFNHYYSLKYNPPGEKTARKFSNRLQLIQYAIDKGIDTGLSDLTKFFIKDALTIGPFTIQPEETTLVLTEVEGGFDYANTVCFRKQKASTQQENRDRERIPSPLKELKEVTTLVEKRPPDSEPVSVPQIVDPTIQHAHKLRGKYEIEPEERAQTELTVNTGTAKIEPELLVSPESKMIATAFATTDVVQDALSKQAERLNIPGLDIKLGTPPSTTEPEDDSDETQVAVDPAPARVRAELILVPEPEMIDTSAASAALVREVPPKEREWLKIPRVDEKTGTPPTTKTKDNGDETELAVDAESPRVGTELIVIAEPEMIDASGVTAAIVQEVPSKEIEELDIPESEAEIGAQLLPTTKSKASADVMEDQEVALICDPALELAKDTLSSTSRSPTSMSPTLSVTTDILGSISSLEEAGIEADFASEEKTIPSEAPLSKHKQKQLRKRKTHKGKEKRRKDASKKETPKTAIDKKGQPATLTQQEVISSQEQATAETIILSEKEAASEKPQEKTQALATETPDTKSEATPAQQPKTPEAPSVKRKVRVPLQQRSPDELMKFIQESVSSLQTTVFRERRIFSPSEMRQLLVDLTDEEEHIKVLITVCETGLSKKQRAKWRTRLNNLSGVVRQSSINIEKLIVQIESIKKKQVDTGFIPQIRERSNVRTEFIIKIENLLSSQKTELSTPVKIKPESKQKTTEPFDRTIKDIEQILLTKLQTLQELHLQKANKLPLSKEQSGTLLAVHKETGEIDSLNQLYNDHVLKCQKPSTERLKNLNGVLQTAYYVHGIPEDDIITSCTEAMTRLEIHVERNHTCSRIFLMFSDLYEKISDQPQLNRLTHHLEDLFTIQAYRRHFHEALYLIESICKLKPSKNLKFAVVMESSVTTYFSIQSDALGVDIYSVLYSLEMLKKFMITLSDSPLKYSTLHLQLYRNHLHYISKHSLYCKAAFFNNPSSTIEETSLMLNHLMQKYGTEELSNLLQGTIETLYQQDCILFAAQIMTWQIEQPIAELKPFVPHLNKVPDLYERLKWDPSGSGTVFMRMYKFARERMQIQANTRMRLGQNMEKLSSQHDDYPQWTQCLTPDTDKKDVAFWTAKPAERSVEIGACKAARMEMHHPDIRSDQLDQIEACNTNFDEKLSASMEDLYFMSGEGAEETETFEDTLNKLKKLSFHDVAQKLLDAYNDIKNKQILLTKHRETVLNTAKFFVIASETIVSLGEYMSIEDIIPPGIDLQENKVTILMISIEAYKQALYMQLIYCIIVNTFGKDQANLFLGANIPRPDISKIANYWENLSKELIRLNQIDTDTAKEICYEAETLFHEHHNVLFQLAAQQKGFYTHNTDFLQHRARCLSIAGYHESALEMLDIFLSSLTKHKDYPQAVAEHAYPIPTGFLDTFFALCIQHMRGLESPDSSDTEKALMQTKAISDFTHTFENALKALELLTQNPKTPDNLKVRTMVACRDAVDKTRKKNSHYIAQGLYRDTLQSVMSDIEKTVPMDHNLFETCLKQQIYSSNVNSLENETGMAIRTLETLMPKIEAAQTPEGSAQSLINITQDNLLKLSACIQKLHEYYRQMHQHMCYTFSYAEVKTDAGNTIIVLTKKCITLENLAKRLFLPIQKNITGSIQTEHLVELNKCHSNMHMYAETVAWLKLVTSLPAEIVHSINFKELEESLRKKLYHTKKLIDEKTPIPASEKLPRFLIDIVFVQCSAYLDFKSACEALNIYMKCVKNQNPEFEKTENIVKGDPLKFLHQKFMQYFQASESSIKAISNDLEHKHQSKMFNILTMHCDTMNIIRSLARDRSFEHADQFKGIVDDSMFKKLQKLENKINRHRANYQGEERHLVKQFMHSRKR